MISFLIFVNLIYSSIMAGCHALAIYKTRKIENITHGEILSILYFLFQILCFGFLTHVRFVMLINAFISGFSGMIMYYNMGRIRDDFMREKSKIELSSSQDKTVESAVKFTLSAIIIMSFVSAFTSAFLFLNNTA